MNNKKDLRWCPLWLFIGWMQVFIVFYLSLMSNPPSVVSFEMADKFHHLLAYLVLMLWFAQIYSPQRFKTVAWVLLTMGILIEILQGQTEDRYFEYSDIVANSSGVLLGFFLARSPVQYGLVRLEERLFK
ncbi:MAG: VanZ family protein [SAR324 cluster bacterium]|nr:VanZ family protein [SAR324 cluster bacterium]